MYRFEQQLDEASSLRLPVVTITDFASGEAGKEVLLLVAGEHGRELITSDIIYWLGKALSGKAEELLHWPTVQQVLSKAQAATTGLKGNSLELWLEGLLQKCVFKVIMAFCLVSCSHIDHLRPSQCKTQASEAAAFVQHPPF